MTATWLRFIGIVVTAVGSPLAANLATRNLIGKKVDYLTDIMLRHLVDHGEKPPEDPKP